MYLVVAMLLVQGDAFVCYGMKKQFNLKASIFVCLIWPISTPITIWKAYQECKKYKEL
jgi:hypothetical protein